jgi:hypothetical protein
MEAWLTAERCMSANNLFTANVFVLIAGIFIGLLIAERMRRRR